MKIKKITREHYCGPVYNLGVENDHTYFANGALVHNCRSTLIPVTKFESYKVSKEIPLDKLRKDGGNMVYNEGNMPALVVSDTIKEFGDKVIIAAAGENLSVSVKRISVANLSHIDPVVVGFRESLGVQLRYLREVKYSQPFDMCFDDGWILPVGQGLVMNLTAPIETTYTIEYEILGPMMERIR